MHLSKQAINFGKLLPAKIDSI